MIDVRMMSLRVGRRMMISLYDKLTAACRESESNLRDGKDYTAILGFDRVADNRIDIDHFFNIFHGRFHEALNRMFRHVFIPPLIRNTRTISNNPARIA